MISEAIAIITKKLNEHCTMHFHFDDDVVVLGGINNISQQNSGNNQNKLIVSLVKIEKSTAYKSQNIASSSVSSQRVAPSLYLDLSVLISANFENDRYSQGLKVLSQCIQFMHNNPVLSRENTPDLDEQISKLMLEIENLAISETNSLWGMLGRHYVPSLLYKVRAVGMKQDMPMGRTFATSAPDTKVAGR